MDGLILIDVIQAPCTTGALFQPVQLSPAHLLSQCLGLVDISTRSGLLSFFFLIGEGLVFLELESSFSFVGVGLGCLELDFSLGVSDGLDKFSLIFRSLM